MVAVSEWLAEERSPCHINMSINLLTTSICERTINKFSPIRNKLTLLCLWAENEEHKFKSNGGTKCEEWVKYDFSLINMA